MIIMNVVVFLADEFYSTRICGIELRSVFLVIGNDFSV
jgi:hypothetical protein